MRAALLLVSIAACGSDPPAVDPGWMTSLPDDRSLAKMSIPGTHESASLYEPLGSGLTKCQNMTLPQQLKAGIRYFDIRCRHLSDEFQIYHSLFFQQQSFDDVLAAMYAFLDDHPDEALIMSVKEEYSPEMNTRTFAKTFESYVMQAPNRWHLAASIPSLGEVRGKIVLVRRFPSATTPLGIDADTLWDDDKTFTMMNPEATVRVQDEYHVSVNDEKWAAITSLFDEAAAGPATTWYINYTSGYQEKSGLPNTPSVSNDINARLSTYFADPSRPVAVRYGTVASDFTTESRIRAVIAHNAP